MEFISDTEIEIASKNVFEEKLNYHCIWFGKTVLDHHIVCIKSLFKTQKNPTVYFWTDTESYAHLLSLKETFADQDFRILIGSNILKECAGYYALSFRSDYWRFQILEQFGGIFFDLDILFLKDISWFANFRTPIVQEGFSTEKVFNTALMYFPARHAGVRNWLQKSGTEFLGWKKLFEIQRWDDPNFGASLIPNVYTDAGWIGLAPSFDDFFEKKDFFTGDELINSKCFVYHWHNRYNKSFDIPNTLANFSKQWVFS